MRQYLCLLLFALSVIDGAPSLGQANDVAPVDPRYFSPLAEPTEIQKVTLDLGVIHSIIIPTSWDADNFAWPGVRKYVKTRSGSIQLDDPKVDFEVDAPVLISSQQAEQLKNAMGEKQLTQEQIYSLKSLPHTVIETTEPNNKTSATVLEIKGKKVLLIECSEQHKGYCLIPGATTLIDRVRGVVYILSDTNKVQTISFDAEVLNDISRCKGTIEKAIKSIEWSK